MARKRGIAVALLVTSCLLQSVPARAANYSFSLRALPRLFTANPHTYGHLVYPQILGFAPHHGFLVEASLPNSPKLTNLYILAASSGHMTTLVKGQSQSQIRLGAVSGDWAIWELATHKGIYIVCKNLRSGSLRRVANAGVSGRLLTDISDPTVHNNDLYWLATWQQDGKLITSVQRLDLLTGKQGAVATFNSEATNEVVIGMAIHGGVAYLSITNSSNPFNLKATGRVVALSLEKGSSSVVVGLQHAAGYITVFGEYIALIYNTSKVPNGPNNLTPYPIVIYNRKTRRQIVVRFDGNLASPTAYRNIVVADGIGSFPVIFDLKSKRAWKLNAFWSAVYGQWFTWGTKTNLYWERAGESGMMH